MLAFQGYEANGGAGQALLGECGGLDVDQYHQAQRGLCDQRCLCFYRTLLMLQNKGQRKTEKETQIEREKCKIREADR